MRNAGFGLAFGLVALAGVAATAWPAAAADAAHGKTLVERNCSACHAIDLTGDSPLPIAPRFRELAHRYPIEALAEPLAEGIITGHDGMPEFEATPEQIDDIIAYLASIQR